MILILITKYKKTDFYNGDFLEHDLIKYDYKYKNLFQEKN